MYHAALICSLESHLALINFPGLQMSDTDLTKRAFLQVMGASVPMAKLFLGAAGAQTASGKPSKFTPLNCSAYFNASAANLGRREQAKDLSSEGARDGMLRTPSGSQRFRGIPFELGPGGEPTSKAWIGLARGERPWTLTRVELPARRTASFICLAQFCDWDTNEKPEPGSSLPEKVGQELARLSIVYEDGSEHVQPIRRRFEVNSLSVPLVHLCFCAVPHRQDRPRGLDDSLRKAAEWGDLQMAAWSGDYPGPYDVQATLWISAIENPEPARAIKTLRFEASSQDPLMLCGVTLFHGKEHPLRYERLTPLRMELPPGTAYEPDRWAATVDLGVIARSYPQRPFEGDHWLSSPAQGLGEVRGEGAAKYFVVELAASPEATLTVEDKKTGHRDEFPLRQVYGKSEPATRIEFLDRQRTWLHGTVTDKDSGRPTPVRIAFRSMDGRYIPPYGHRTEINPGWFQDYGADIKMADSSFAYVDGSFQIELPVGEVFVEVSKGFEYSPIRKKIRDRKSVV